MYSNKLENAKLCGSTITTVVVKYLNSASREVIIRESLQALLDKGTEESFLNKKWIKFAK